MLSLKKKTDITSPIDPGSTTGKTPLLSNIGPTRSQSNNSQILNDSNNTYPPARFQNTRKTQKHHRSNQCLSSSSSQVDDPRSRRAIYQSCSAAPWTETAHTTRPGRQAMPVDRPRDTSHQESHLRLLVLLPSALTLISAPLPGRRAHRHVSSHLNNVHYQAHPGWRWYSVPGPPLMLGFGIYWIRHCISDQKGIRIEQKLYF